MIFAGASKITWCKKRFSRDYVPDIQKLIKVSCDLVGTIKNIWAKMHFGTFSPLFTKTDQILAGHKSGPSENFYKIFWIFVSTYNINKICENEQNLRTSLWPYV